MELRFSGERRCYFVVIAAFGDCSQLSSEFQEITGVTDPMTHPLQLRPYQQECLDKAIEENTIVHLPTGQGKTLIAARLIEHFLELHPEKKIAFLVPTRALVEQQSKYLHKHCLANEATVRIELLIGDRQAHWRQDEWNQSLDDSQIYCGTAAIFQSLLVETKYIDVSRFSLVIFDECHNATGNSPMASVMRDAVAPFYLQQERYRSSPRVLGLTASFDNGNSKNLPRKRAELERLLQSRIFCPDVEQRIQEERYISISDWKEEEDVKIHKETIENHVKTALKKTAKIKDIEKVVSRCSHVFEELGLKALFYYIRQVILSQIHSKISFLESRDHDQKCLDLAKRMRLTMPNLEKDVTVLHDRLEQDLSLKSADIESKKLQRLIVLLEGLHRDKAHSFRGIIFVEQVALVSTLAHLLNEHFEVLEGNFKSKTISFGAVAGAGSQTEEDRQRQLDMFGRTGEHQVLVSSAALEEGIDVAECGFVVRYTAIHTPKAHIQGSGRARREDALIYYFENNPDHELDKESSMTTVARNSALCLTPKDLKRAASSISNKSTPQHPFPSDGGEGQVTVYNCKQIFNRYCSVSLGTCFQPKYDLYEYVNDDLGLRPKSLAKVRYPAPDGWKSMTISDFKEFWGEDMEYVFGCAERTKKKTAAEKEEMCFIYMIVVELRKTKLLDRRNAADPLRVFETRRNCPLKEDYANESISIKNNIFQSSTGSSL